MEKGTQNGASSLLNSYASTIIDTTTMPGYILIPGLPPINAMEYGGYDKTVSATELQQIKDIGVATAPTILAATRYQVKLGNTGIRYIGAQNVRRPYGATSPASLTSASVDRQNVYWSIASKINADLTAFATAYPLVQVSHVAGTLGGTPWAAGETLTAPSGASGIVVSGALGGAGTTIVAMTTVTNFASSELITSSGGGTATTNAAVTQGYGLRIKDKAGYYDPAFKRNRLGANDVLLTQGLLPQSTYLQTTQNARYAFGQGADLLKQVPVVELSSGNLSQGTFNFPINNPPITGDTYTLVRLKTYPLVSVDAKSDQAVRYFVYLDLWLNEGDADYAAVITAINNLVVQVG